ncbi:class I SAM-dependent methyltransferase [archaeon]|nr:class I SAM-dependent methyltransferase [archaeon]
MPNSFRTKVLILLFLLFFILIGSINTLSFYPIFVLFLIVLSKYGTTFFGASWISTPKNKFNKIAKAVMMKPSQRVYDLGCGNGKFLAYVSKRYGVFVRGVELDPFRWLYANLQLKIAGAKGHVILGNFYKTDISNADVVFIYLPQDTVDKIQQKLKTAKKGTLIVSYVSACKKLRLVKSLKNDRIYVYRI